MNGPDNYDSQRPCQPGVNAGPNTAFGEKSRKRPSLFFPVLFECNNRDNAHVITDKWPSKGRCGHCPHPRPLSQRARGDKDGRSPQPPIPAPRERHFRASQGAIIRLIRFHLPAGRD